MTLPFDGKRCEKIGVTLVRGLDNSRAADAIFVNAPLRDYEKKPRYNDFTLPVIGLGYIATVASEAGQNVGVIDGEALGLSFRQIASEVNRLNPRWVGFNLLAPTYTHSVQILRLLNHEIKVMLGGHQAKALPRYVLQDAQIPRVDALILGEAEHRVAAVLSASSRISELPKVFWRTKTGIGAGPQNHTNKEFLSPDINALPYVDRAYFVNDPYRDGGLLEAAIVGSRGCPFDCSFCGAAISANRDVEIRTRSPKSILGELFSLKGRYGVDAVRFIDDLFLANIKTMTECASAFISEDVGVEWDATGRINVIASASARTIDLLKRSGCREVALGIETASDRLLRYIDKKITLEQIEGAVQKLCSAGINVKGYFIFGLPTETNDEHNSTLALIHRLWGMTDKLPGRFRCSVFEYRPYPGTPDWHRLVARGYDISKMLTYDEVDITDDGSDPLLLDRDEFNFTTGLVFSDVPLVQLRKNLREIMRLQKVRISNENPFSGTLPQAKPANRRNASPV